MDDRPDERRDRSPWERDDWQPEPFEPHWPSRPGADAGPAPEPERDARSPGGPSSGPSGGPSSGPEGGAARSGRGNGQTAPTAVPGASGDERVAAPSPAPPRSRVQAAFVVGAAIVIAVVAVVLLRDGPSADEAASDGATRVESSIDGSPVVGADVPDPTGNAGSSPNVSAGAPTIAPGTDVTGNGEGTGEPPIAQVVHGEAPAWSESTVGVPPPLDSMQVPTEVVTIDADGILRRTEFPTGRTRSVGVVGLGPSPFVVVGDDAVVAYGGTQLVLIPDDGPVRFLEIGDGVAVVQARPGIGDYLVTAVSPTAASELEFSVTSDGPIELVEDDPVLGVALPERNFLPDGKLIVERPGGVYTLTPDGEAARIADGDLLAVGSNHYAVEECDVALVCSETVIDIATGERFPAELVEVSERSQVSRSTQISPDGRSVVYRDDTRGTGIQRMVSVADGRGIDVVRPDGFQFENPWAADSSGIFVERDGSLLFQPRASAQIVVVDLAGPIGATILDVGVRPSR